MNIASTKVLGMEDPLCQIIYLKAALSHPWQSSQFKSVMK